MYVPSISNRWDFIASIFIVLSFVFSMSLSKLLSFIDICTLGTGKGNTYLESQSRLGKMF